MAAQANVPSPTKPATAPKIDTAIIAADANTPATCMPVLNASLGVKLNAPIKDLLIFRIAAAKVKMIGVKIKNAPAPINASNPQTLIPSANLPNPTNPNIAPTIAPAINAALTNIAATVVPTLIAVFKSRLKAPIIRSLIFIIAAPRSTIAGPITSNAAAPNKTFLMSIDFQSISSNCSISSIEATAIPPAATPNATTMAETSSILDKSRSSFDVINCAAFITAAPNIIKMGPSMATAPATINNSFAFPPLNFSINPELFNSSIFPSNSKDAYAIPPAAAPTATTTAAVSATVARSRPVSFRSLLPRNTIPIPKITNAAARAIRIPPAFIRSSVLIFFIWLIASSKNEESADGMPTLTSSFSTLIIFPSCFI